MKRMITLGVAALAASLVLTACGGDENPNGTAVTNPSASTEDHSDADVTFAQMMIPHHAQAVEMSDLVLGKAGMDAGVAALAAQIKAAQQPEIDQMSGWLDAWGEDMPAMGGMDHPMNGMMSQQDVDAIGAATGADAALLYLESMKIHHQGAIEMAKSEASDGSSPEAVALAEVIITTQQAEIIQIEDLLATR